MRLLARAQELWHKGYQQWQPPGSRRGKWLAFIRKLELERSLAVLGSEVSLDKISSVLEIGSGRGDQAAVLAKTFSHVIASDVDVSSLQRPYVTPVVACSAEALCFPDDSFDLILSSNVIEHIPDKVLALREMKRTLRPGGIMVHVVPTLFCQLFTLLVAKYAFQGMMLVSFFRELAKCRRSREQRSSPAGTHVSCGGESKTPVSASRGYVIRVLRLLLPLGVHGTAPNTFQEILEYRHCSWQSLLEESGLVVLTTRNMLLYSMYMILPFRFLAVRMWLARLGITTTRAYVVRIAQERNRGSRQL